MSFTRTSRSLACAAAACVLATGSVVSAPLPMLVTADARQARAGTATPAAIFVHLAKPDGTPKTDGQLLVPTDPKGGVELKNSRWTFRTLSVPSGYAGQLNQAVPASAQNPMGGTRPVFYPGELRIMSVQAYEKAGAGAAEGLYVLTVIPVTGTRGTRRTPLLWSAGEYHFVVSYKDGTDQGTGFGTLVVRQPQG